VSRRIDVTVAAVIEEDERYLVVEEQAAGQLVYNQPAGHLEPGESLVEAVIRETLEETGFRFEPRSLLGIYLWRHPHNDVTLLRVAFTGDATPPAGQPVLDDGIVATHWMTRNQLLGHSARLRSPLVLRSIDDYRAGTRHPLQVLQTVEVLSALQIRTG
jgi:8-oxo-dGTP pyrophosphatase MutT (NUDIX family)